MKKKDYDLIMMMEILREISIIFRKKGKIITSFSNIPMTSPTDLSSKRAFGAVSPPSDANKIKLSKYIS